MEYEIITRKEALSQGLTHYFTGKQCRNGHISLRTARDKDCLKCKANRALQYYHDNHEKEKQSRRNRYANNPEPQRKRIRKYNQDNRGKVKLKRILRKQSVERATPNWADMKTIQKIYHDCPLDHEVDHIVPINGKTVCGLHIPNNLQYLTKSENCSKGNRFWPDMW